MAVTIITIAVNVFVLLPFNGFVTGSMSLCLLDVVMDRTLQKIEVRWGNCVAQLNHWWDRMEATAATPCT